MSAKSASAKPRNTYNPNTPHPMIPERGKEYIYFRTGEVVRCLQWTGTNAQAMQSFIGVGYAHVISEQPIIGYNGFFKCPVGNWVVIRDRTIYHVTPTQFVHDFVITTTTTTPQP